jgi:hypothetical protein
MPLAILGVVVFFAGRSEAGGAVDEPADELALGYDFSQGYTSLDRDPDEDAPPRAGPVRQWLERRRQGQQRRQRQQAREDELRVDAVLARLHERGMSGLSPEDRALLLRVSARYRGRLRQD